MLRLAVVGPAGAGKSSLMRALGARPGAHEVVIQVPDPTLEALAEIYNPQRVVGVQMVLEEPPGPRPLPPKAREAQGLVVVVRGFEGEPAAQWRELDEEMVVGDLVAVEGRLERIRAERAKGRRIDEAELKALERAKEVLAQGRALREEPALRDAAVLRGFGLWSAKAVVVVVNLADEGPQPPLPGDVHALQLRCRLQAELMELDPDDREEFIRDMALEADAAGAVAAAVVQAMDLVTFYTVVGREVRAWVVPRGTTAWEAAGEIHSDMQRGFIRAEVMDAREVIEAGGEGRLRAEGRVRVVAKDYELRDAEVFIVRFSV